MLGPRIQILLNPVVPTDKAGVFVDGHEIPCVVSYSVQNDPKKGRTVTLEIAAGDVEVIDRDAKG
jgi:hypothetical protein